MSGRHTGPIGLRTDAEWVAHVRTTKRAALTVGVVFLLSLGVLIAVILHKSGVI